jgi:hypothetical protein
LHRTDDVRKLGAIRDRRGRTICLIGFFVATPANKAVDLTLAVSSQPQASIATAERHQLASSMTGTPHGREAASRPK